MVELGHIAGLRLTARPSALVALVVMWVILSVVAINWLRLSVGTAILGALVATLLHFVFELVHHIGHSIAAKRTGYPMIGVRFWGPLASSIYPKDEPALPGKIHIQRALGGPIMSGLVTLVVGLLHLFLSGAFTIGQAEPHLGAVIPAITYFVFLDNLLIFTLGAFLPLGFTDGSTILHWWGK
ncbi:MAG: hypothetical protein H0X30_19100 [Anaerolineae bacterium]|nr:hypothetical protein [Anaerolineae bacterium]